MNTAPQRHLLALVPLLLCASACTSGSPRRVSPSEMTRMLVEAPATMRAANPLAISGERAYVELWEKGSGSGSIEIVWTPVGGLTDDVRARFPHR